MSSKIITKEENKESLNYIFYHNENLNLKNINEELIKNIELYEKENAELKKIIEQLNKELNYKDKYLEECLKIISELKNNYYIKNNNKKEEENKKNEEDINWSKDDKKNEFQKYINENIILKKNLNLLKIEYNEKVKKLNEISKAYDESKNKNNNYIEMLKEREKIIENNEKKIKNLLKENNAKEDQLNLLMKYKKDDNNIKNNKNNYEINIFPKEEIFNINILENNILNDKNIHFKLEQALKEILYIPSNSKHSLTKEYLIDMNFKTELLKIECFSNFKREFDFLELIYMFFEKLSKYNYTKELVKQIFYLISDYNKIKEDNNKYKMDINKFKAQIKDLYLYIYKIRDELYGQNNNFKLKMNHLITLYEIKIKQIKDKYKFNDCLYKNMNLINEHISSIYIKTSNIKKKENNIANNNKENNNKNKLEIERLKKEIAVLIKDINNQQNEISNYKKIKLEKENNLNKNIFIISDYMKYSLIYDINDTKEILNLFIIMMNNMKNDKKKGIIIFIEMLKNFLIVIEKIKSNSKKEYKEELNKAFNIFTECCNDKINELTENDIFLRKLIINLFYIAFF